MSIPYWKKYKGPDNIIKNQDKVKTETIDIDKISILDNSVVDLFILFPYREVYLPLNVCNYTIISLKIA